MSEPRLISPLLDGYMLGESFNSHDGVSCFPAMNSASDKKYIVKAVSFPPTQEKLEALLLAGAFPDRASALPYFQDQLNSLVEEAELLKTLSQQEGFVSYDSWQAEPMDGDATGLDLYLLSPYRRTLERFLRRHPMTHLGAVNMGLDLCDALSMCRRQGYLYVDLKPGNIAIGDDQHYSISDLGFVKLSSLEYASLPARYISAYTAPEVADAYSTLNATMDVYALGLVLYQVFNNGKLPFDGRAPEEALPAPAYADYEMAQIILKACSPDPSARWLDPSQMGQALVDYMQRNSVNDTPITPPAAILDQQTEAFSEADELPGDDDELSTDQILAVVDEALTGEDDPQNDGEAPADGEKASGEETAEAADELPEAPEEVEHILAQADDLIAHEAPEPVEVPLPKPIFVPPLPKPVPEEAPAEEAEETAEEQPEEEPEEEKPMLPRRRGRTRKPMSKGVLIGLIAVLLAAVLALGGYLFYFDYYLQAIDHIKLEGEQNALTVTLDTQIEDQLLTVICSDSHGNTLRESVSDGVAQFDELRPDTQYTITVEISGFHKLTGKTEALHTTPKQGTVSSFTAVTGAEDSSVILNFAVLDTDSDNWNVFYAAEGEEEQSVSFTGHTVTITGLTVGKTYRFRLESADGLYLVGENTVEYTLTGIISAENLTVLGVQDRVLTATWSAPEGATVESWTVHCYSSSGYDKTLTVTETTAAFEDADAAADYTIEVYAAGMTVGARTYVSANSASVSDLQIDSSNPNQLLVSWKSETGTPEGGWLLLYTVDGGEQQVVQCASESGVIVPVIPGSRYALEIRPANGSTIFGGTGSYDAPDSPVFSSYTVQASDLIFKMCKTPEKADWTEDDVPAADYTTTFAPGAKASFAIRVDHTYNTSSDMITTLFVIRDANGKVVSTSTQERTWTNMWYRGFGRLNMHPLPDTAGAYTVDIYFNGAYVTRQEFTIQ